MEGFESKKLALIRIWQILKEYSDYDHPLTQDAIAAHLENDYGIIIERKAVSRNISLLKEADIEIRSCKAGSYIECREFDDSELRMLIDGVLSSRHINATHSKDLIERICGLSNKYFKSHIKNIYSVNDWSKTDNQALFYNIGIIDTAIEKGKQLSYNYNKYGADKKLHKSSYQKVSPYQTILHNQRYYLMAYSEYWGNMVFHRLDHITNMRISETNAAPINSVPGYRNGIDYKIFSSSMPYMYSDEPERIEFIADACIIDQIIDWFGYETLISERDDGRITAGVKASPIAMEHWAMQYINYVEITKPESLKMKIKNSLENAIKKYK